ncbi:hypothetical protein GE061_017626 [Apolygus lucorum]|uniref:Cilia- and flagella-associated protein 69 ARM repeats domain-containing protein n=1 Tax=Apolygus lucorum TaxID=248454 RepID=A0A8S9XBP6_APOLU|nr:hypothetical protein GE061_017626 [Apolygus lucorum]
MVADIYNVLPGLSLLISTDSGKSDTASWPPEYRCQLISYALHALPVLAEYLPTKYIASGVTRKILDLLENSVKLPQATELMKCTLHCLNNLIIKGICPKHFPDETVPTSCLPVQVLLMAVLADLSNDNSTIPQIVTWRGDTEKETVLALLSSVWRKQEAMKEVKRDGNGCITAATEMQGCARPKIYAIYYNIIRRHSETAESSREAYGVDIHNIGFKDEITLKIIDNFEFFKKGEVWKNLWSGLLNIKTRLLPQIETTLVILAKTYLYTAGNIATVQQSVNAKEIKKDLDREKALYDELRSCMLTEALDSFMIIRNELYSTNREQATTAKVLLEKELTDQRQRMDIDVMVPEYHTTRVIGVNLAKSQPSLAIRVRKNSNLIRAEEHLNKKQKEDENPGYSFVLYPKP